MKEIRKYHNQKQWDRYNKQSKEKVKTLKDMTPEEIKALEEKYGMKIKPKQEKSDEKDIKE